MNAIQCEHIYLSFAHKCIFEDLNFSIRRGERVAISGASGKGKSTLLKLLQGYITPQQGNILINGEKLSPSTIKHIRKQIIWIPQNIHLPVNNGLEVMKLMEIEAHESQIFTLGSQLGVSADIFSQDFHTISGGQKQRVIISICLSLDKEIILMDEPTSSLDEGSVQSLIQTTQSFTHKTIISSSHNPSWLNSAHRVIEL